MDEEIEMVANPDDALKFRASRGNTGRTDSGHKKANRVARLETYKETDSDFYPTPPYTIGCLLQHEPDIIHGTVLEPSCGQGHLSEELKFYKRIYGGNPEDVTSRDLIDRGYGDNGLDFLKSDDNEKFDYIVTNPPFAIANSFVEKALKKVNKKVIMFLPIRYLEGGTRYDKLFSTNNVSKLMVFSDRVTLKKGIADPPISYLEDGENRLHPLDMQKGSTMATAWFEWDVREKTPKGSISYIHSEMRDKAKRRQINLR